MKTLRFLALVCIILVFTAKINAQSISEKWIDLPNSMDVPCIPESADGIVTMHALFHIDKDGNWTTFHFNLQEGVFVGKVTGTIYRPVGNSQEHIKTTSTNGALTYTYVNRCSLQGTGKGSVRVELKEFYHFTVTKDGDISVLIDKAESICE
jgi:hypothetical protein